jgi:uncharacterized Zn finger protein (UPF0148 family)
MALHCPTCKATILSRRNKLCSSCQNPLPAEFLFTAAEVQEIEAAEREREKRRRLREEERLREAAKIRSSDGGDSFIGMGG